MFFFSKRIRRDPYRIDLSEADKPIRLDEARLEAWALALGQRRETRRPAFRPHRGQLPDVDFSQVVRVRRAGLIAGFFRWLLGDNADDDAAGATAGADAALGEGRRKPYVWLVETDADAIRPKEPKSYNSKLNGNRAA
ncbi:MAG: hypothetical protein KF810_00335 [Rhizobiaceae bacterium]|nr:hypothetical protein [Rhizobiaceae bacterium]